MTNLNAFVGYAPLSEVLVGAGVTQLRVEDEFFDDSVSGYEIFAQYRTPTGGAAIVYSVPDSDQDDTDVTSFLAEAEVTAGLTFGAIIDDIATFDENVYNLSVDYTQGPIAVRGYYSGVTGEDLAIYGARGSYDFGNNFSAIANLAGLEDFIADEGSFVTIGAAYEFTPGFSVDASFGRADLGGDDADVIQIGLNYEIGAPTRLDTKMTNAIRDDRRNGLSVLLPDAGFGAVGFGFF